MTQPHGPLHGVKVVACSTAQAGTVPYMLMADLGAEVIKIEVPEIGDNSRGSSILPGMPSTYFETNNRGVKSVTLNLKTKEGREILHKLVAQAEMFGQKVDCSLLGGQIRLMGWTLTTAMWRDRNPVTGQARIVGTPERPGISASFNDRDGKPLVFQLNGARQWRDGMTALGFYERLAAAGFGELGVVMSSDDERVALLGLLDELFATGSRDDWVARLRGADIVSAPINTLLEASNDPDVLANGYVAEVGYPK